MSFLPINKKDLKDRGWSQCDFILVNGDAYVDHPSFGGALVGRYLQGQGYKVGIISQPGKPEDYQVLGPPRFAWLVSSGNMDSMVNHYTANRKPRSEDLYSPGGKAGLRPDRALIPYCSAIKAAYKGIPVILGGVEASLRRLAHYDYWSDKIRRSMLLDSKADLLVYGMAEVPLKTLCRRLAEGEGIQTIKDIPGTVVLLNKGDEAPDNAQVLPSYEDMLQDKKAFVQAFNIQSRENHPWNGHPVVQLNGTRRIMQNPPALPLSTKEMDAVYALPFTRRAHPSYGKKGGIPALKEVQFSLTSSRGCFGGCSFCAITFHQGEVIQSRSIDSLLDEAEAICRDDQFKGIIHDVGGPTANFRHPSCKKQGVKGPCPQKKCLYPKPCPNLDADHSDYVELLRRLRKLDGVRKVFIRSGIRFDYLMQDNDSRFLEDLCKHHVSGQLKVAPEHVSKEVLRRMGKPGPSVYREFKKRFEKTNDKLGKKQFLIPYLIASHPGTGLKEGIEMALFLKESGFIPQQVQDFYPTPGTLSSVMYYTGIDPRDGSTVYVPKKGRERAMLRALMQFNRKENYPLVREALKAAGRQDLIGKGPRALVPPR